MIIMINNDGQSYKGNSDNNNKGNIQSDYNEIAIIVKS